MRGELFWAEVVHNDGVAKRRPVLELSAPELRSPIVVPVTSNVRGLPSEVPIDVGGVSGVLNTIAAGPIRRENLTESIGLVPDRVMDEVCSAMAWTTGCRVR